MEPNELLGGMVGHKSQMDTAFTHSASAYNPVQYMVAMAVMQHAIY